MIWLVLVLGFVITALGSMAGAALVAVSRAELTRAVAHRLRGSTPELRYLAEVDQDLAGASVTTSLGVLLLGAAIPAVLAGAGILELGLLLLFVAAPFVLATGYLLPRWLTVARAESVARRLVPLLRPWFRAVGLALPARGAARANDFSSIWREGAAAGLHANEELLMAGGVMAFSQRPVREVMTPRTDLVAVPADAGVEEIAAVFASSGYSRLPVYRGTMDEIIGMLHAFDLFKLRPGNPLPVRPVAVSPGSRSAGDLLLDMQRERRHLAVVIDEFGGTLGIVTLEDLLEELVGEIFDEHDREGEPDGATAAAPELLDVDGAAPAAEVGERFGVELPRGRANTLGGLVAELAGRIPAPGERFTLGGLELDILDSTPTRIERILVRPGPVHAVTLLPPGA